MVKELFYFYPEKEGFNPFSINRVCIVGEFNDWGRNAALLKNYELVKDNEGRWQNLIDIPEGYGQYKYFLNGITLYPDKMLFYSTASTCDWAKNAFFYQIMPDRFFKGNLKIKTPNQLDWDDEPNYFDNFGGDFKGIENKIPYLKSLFGSLENVCLYLNPINKSLASNHKYWPEDFEAIDEQFGTEDEFKSLIKALHEENAKIIIDLVYNHCGLNHFAFQDVLKKGNNSKYYNWFRWLPDFSKDKIEIPCLEDWEGDKPQNIEFENNPNSKDFNPAKESCISVWGGKYKFPLVEARQYVGLSVYDMLDRTPYYKLVHKWNKPNYSCWAGIFELPELNTANKDLQEHLYNAAKKWLRLGVDGFRLDVPDLLSDTHNFWKEFRLEMNKELALLGKPVRDLYITGEIWTNKEFANTFVNTDKNGEILKYDSNMNYPLREAVLNFFSGELLNSASDSVKSFGEITVSQMDRAIHQNFEYVPFGVNQVQYNVISSHDTRRLRTILNDDRKLKAVILMQFTLLGVPAIYYGDEIGLMGGKDPENRRTMNWTVAENIFEYKDNAEIFDWIKTLIEKRRKYKCFNNSPAITLLCDDVNKIYGYLRYLSPNDYAIVVVTKQFQVNDITLNLENTTLKEVYGSEYVVKSEDLNENFGVLITPV